MNRVLLVRTCLACCLSLGIGASAYAQLPGAIFTTLENGTRVNANIYQAKCGSQGVWLDGGPGPNAPQGAAGLPDGDYYFQVTDPSGKTLLSTDPVADRHFHVTNGIISDSIGTLPHNTDLDVDHGATTIELCPYLDTPNPGGVYKVWITPVGRFAGDPLNVDNSCGRGCFHGFIPAFSKTDNFKVQSGAGGACLEVLKVIDADGDGSINGPDYLVTWPVTITDPLGTTNTFWTGAVKECTFAQLPPGLYQVTEAATDGNGSYQVTLNWVDGQYTSSRKVDTTVLIRVKDSSSHEVVFGNAPVTK